MIGLYLILIGLVIIYLTTPKNRKKFRKKRLAISSQLAYVQTKFKKTITKDKHNSQPRITIRYGAGIENEDCNSPAKPENIDSPSAVDIEVEKNTNIPSYTPKIASPAHASAPVK
ncbi:hypothetical protein [Pedobacter miscanthi]|uniref:hypothetical protein n=1 Tax=Pedobacter miscanthi TaxID=2259170 RepID=UPI00292CE527|nr:hypothetical protein [Pedobacter miscanthi]